MDGKAGYDILSFDNNARPVCLEVKTSIHPVPANGLHLTAKELRVAQGCLDARENYVLCSLTNWGKANQRRQDIPFRELMTEYETECTGVRFRKKSYAAQGCISGIAYHRKRKGLNQTQLAELTGMQQGNICLYEHGRRTPSLQVLKRLYGPSGCGKTAIIREAAKVAGLPFLTVDAAGITETGYRGKNAADIVTDLLAGFKEHPHVQHAIIFIDEVDKLAAYGGDWRQAYCQ